MFMITWKRMKNTRRREPWTKADGMRWGRWWGEIWGWRRQNIQPPLLPSKGSSRFLFEVYFHDLMLPGQLFRRLFCEIPSKFGLFSITSRTRSYFHPSSRCKMLHHLMVGTWTPPGAIFTFQFDDKALTLKMIKRTAIPEDEPISWMTFDVSLTFCLLRLLPNITFRF